MTDNGSQSRRAGLPGCPENGFQTTRRAVEKKTAGIMCDFHSESGAAKSVPDKDTGPKTLKKQSHGNDASKKEVLYGPQQTGGVLELKSCNSGLQFEATNDTLPEDNLQGARMGDLSDRREARRFVMTLPVKVLAHDANGPELKAHTRDVSYQGLYFLTEARFENGSEIDFVLTLPEQVIPGGDVNIRCHGRVVRVESSDSGKTGIAARIEKYEFVPIRASAA